MKKRRPYGSLIYETIDMATAGKNYREIATALDCSEEYVRAACRRVGIVVAGVRGTPSERRERTIARVRRDAAKLGFVLVAA